MKPFIRQEGVVERLNREVARLNTLPEYQARLRTMTVQASSMPAAEFDDYIKTEVARFDALEKAAKIEPE